MQHNKMRCACIHTEFLFFFFWFWYWMILASQNALVHVPSFSIFWKWLYGLGVNSLTICWNSPVKPSRVADYFYGGGWGLIVKVINLTALIISGLFRLSTSCWMSCGSYFFEKVVYCLSCEVYSVYGVHCITLLSFFSIVSLARNLSV